MFNPLDESILFLFHPTAQNVKLAIFNEDATLKSTLPMQKKGSFWSISIEGFKKPFLYAFYLNNQQFILDPYAKECIKKRAWKDKYNLPILSKVEDLPLPKTSKPYLKKEDLIIYEMHTKGFTQDSSSKVKHPGTFLGLVEKIDYFLDLGINAIELLPLFFFDETDNPNCNTHKEPLCNFWGYDPCHFFAPHPCYGTRAEFLQMVEQCHKKGIEVILDVVFNHMGTIANHLPLFSVAPDQYFLLSDQHHMNYSGCGNTFNPCSSIAQQMILDSLVYWTSTLNVDGFRFDLASCLTRGQDDKVYDELLKKIAIHPELQKCKLIAEPWDCAGRYQLSYFKQFGFSEWNDQFRDSVRSFFLQPSPNKEAFKRALLGTPDFFTPSESINFITAHDGFTLNDLCSYREKHNQENGEENRDGCNHNLSNNHGVEGKTKDSSINNKRKLQQQNLLFALFFSQGIPMLLMGDEYGHTKQGNNNTYGQDNELNYFLWDQQKQNKDQYEFVKRLIQYRKKYRKKLTDPKEIDFLSEGSQKALILLFNDRYILAFNQTNQTITFPLKKELKPLLFTGKKNPLDGSGDAYSLLPFTSLFAEIL